MKTAPRRHIVNAMLCRRLAQLLGWRSFGGRDLDHLKRKVINLKVKGYYLELDAVEKLRRACMKGYGFTLIDGVKLVDKTIHRTEQTILRMCFSDPYTRQLLSRRVVSRPKNLLKMRSELAFVLRLYLEPILLSRGTQKQHSIELLNLIQLLNLPTAGWQISAPTEFHCHAQNEDWQGGARL